MRAPATRPAWPLSRGPMSSASRVGCSFRILAIVMPSATTMPTIVATGIVDCECGDTGHLSRVEMETRKGTLGA
jgi:hypothetical protein